MQFFPVSHTLTLFFSSIYSKIVVEKLETWNSMDIERYIKWISSMYHPVFTQLSAFFQKLLFSVVGSDTFVVFNSLWDDRLKPTTYSSWLLFPSFPICHPPNLFNTQTYFHNESDPQAIGFWDVQGLAFRRVLYRGEGRDYKGRKGMTS